MPRAVPIREGVFRIVVNDRETDLFEALWPMPGGISYNASLVLDERIALVDAVRSPYLPELLARVRAELPPGRAPDYLVLNHVEPDHGGALATLLELYPGMRVVGNAKTLELLAAFQGVTARTVSLGDGEALELGRRRLRVLLTPMVHWPETMMTLLEPDRVLFTGDVFGAFGAIEDGAAAADLPESWLEAESLRYYANVLGRYSSMVRKALARVDAADPAALVPAHGAYWEEGGARVRGWYGRWSRHAAGEGAVVAYASMYGSTKAMAAAVAQGLREVGAAPVAVFDLARTHPSFVLAEIWRRGVLALGSPTYNTEAFPAASHLVRLLRNKRMANRLLGVFGSHGWSGGATAELRALADEPGWRLVEPVVDVRGAPGAEALERCRLLGRELARARAALEN